MRRFPIAISLVLVSSLVLAADAPATVDIDVIAGKKGTVTFEHAKHSAEYKKSGGAAISCKDCHHTLKTDNGKGEPVKKCSECHGKVGEADKEIDGKKSPPLAVERAPGKIDTKSVLFHKSCKDGCHKAMKAEGKKITSCKVCHKK